MKKITFLLFVFLTNFGYSQKDVIDNLHNLIRTNLIDSTLVLIRNELIKSKNYETKHEMDSLVIINSANQLLHNPYSKINPSLIEYRSNRQMLNKKTLKKLFKKLNLTGLNFWKISEININHKYYITVNPIQISIRENKVIISNFTGVAIACFKFKKLAKSITDLKTEWELVSFELSNAYKL